MKIILDWIKKLLASLPIKKIKIALTIAALLSIAGLWINLSIANTRLKKERADNVRLVSNQIQLTGDYRQVTNQVYRLQELNGELRRSIERLADSLKVKPKYITRIEYRTITDIDTVNVPVYVNPLSKDTWAIQDTGKCFIWSGKAKLTGEDLHILRTDFKYSNKLTEVYYRKRAKKLLGFIPIGKRINYHSVSSECGEPRVESFEFIK